jgi:erythromycin esterase-like protein
MWRNEVVRAFTDWLHEWNAPRAPLTRVGFYGLDLYNSTLAIIGYLEDVDPDLARIARHR